MELEVIVGTYDCSIIGYSFDLLSLQENPVLRKKYFERDHVGCVRCVAVGGRYLASGGTDETIKLYNLRRHTEIGSLLHHQGTITGLAFFKDTNLLSCSEDGTICIWKCGGSWECLHTLTGHKYAVSDISIHPSGRLAVSVGRDRSVRTWNLLTGRPAFTLRLPKAADLVQWNLIGSQYVLAVGGSLMVYSLENGEPSCCIEVGKPANTLLYIQDDVLAVGSDHSDILLYSTDTGKKLASLKGHSSRVKGLAMSPDQKLLFSASSDGCIKTWALSDPLKDSCCVASATSGSRLTCLTCGLQDSQDQELTTAACELERAEERLEEEDEGSGTSEDRSLADEEDIDEDNGTVVKRKKLKKAGEKKKSRPEKVSKRKESVVSRGLARSKRRKLSSCSK